MAGCLYNIRNTTTSTFIFPEDITDNTITVKEGSTLYVNFVEDDFNYTKFVFNGEDITSKFSNNRLTLTVTEETNTSRSKARPKSTPTSTSRAISSTPRASSSRLPTEARPLQSVKARPSAPT